MKKSNNNSSENNFAAIEMERIDEEIDLERFGNRNQGIGRNTEKSIFEIENNIEDLRLDLDKYNVFMVDELRKIGRRLGFITIILVIFLIVFLCK